MKTKEEFKKHIESFYDMEKKKSVTYYQSDAAKYFSIIIEILADMRDIMANK